MRACAVEDLTGLGGQASRLEKCYSSQDQKESSPGGEGREESPPTPRGHHRRGQWEQDGEEQSVPGAGMLQASLLALAYYGI